MIYRDIAFHFGLLLIVFLCLSGNKAFSQPIIVDHTCVDKYQDIPEYYLNEVKKMWITIPGESHSVAYRTGCTLLEQLDSRFAVNVVDGGTPEGLTDQHLRISRATWGDLDHESGWIYFYGEEDWFTSETAIARTKAGITYCNTHDLMISAIGLGWCWDVGISFPDYINATDEYVSYCETMGYPTKVIFTTGTVDNAGGEIQYTKHLGYESIRDHVKNSTDLILLDYADILCYDDDGSANTGTWNNHTYPVITAANLGDASLGHISSTGALRLGKAIWYLLARIAGWNGLPDGEDTEAPSAPLNMQASALSITSAQLSWDASTDNTGVIGYKIYRDDEVIDTSLTTSFSDNGLSINNSYSYYVSAFDASGNESEQSNSVIVSTDDIWAPSAPGNLQGTVLSLTSVQLTWDASTDNVGVTAYLIHRDGIVIDSTSELTFTDNGLSAGNNYNYWITAADARANESSQSETILISIENTSATHLSTNNNLKVFPNPSDGRFEIILDGNDGHYQFCIYSIEGIIMEKGIIEIKDDRSLIEVNNLNTGVYFIKILNDRYIFSEIIEVIY